MTRRLYHLTKMRAVRFSRSPQTMQETKLQGFGGDPQSCSGSENKHYKEEIYKRIALCQTRDLALAPERTLGPDRGRPYIP